MILSETLNEDTPVVLDDKAEATLKLLQTYGITILECDGETYHAAVTHRIADGSNAVYLKTTSLLSMSSAVNMLSMDLRTALWNQVTWDLKSF